MHYSLFRELADSWGLLYLLAMFIAVVAFVFRPGSKKISKDVSKIPFREDEINGG